MGSSARSVDLKDVECYNCHKKGHYANKCPESKAKDSKGVFKVRKVEAEKDPDQSIRKIRIRYSDISGEHSDGFLRYWINVYHLGDPTKSPTNEGFMARIFVDTGASCNTINRSFYLQLLNHGITMELIYGPMEGIKVELVGGQTLLVTGDKVRLQVEVATNMGKVASVQEFLVLEEDAEDMVMGVHWHNELVGGHRANLTRIVDLDTFGVSVPNPLDSAQDEAPEYEMFEDSNVESYPTYINEDWEQCQFNHNFPKLDRLKEIVRTHGEHLFKPFDREGLRVAPLNLRVRDQATFKMQPCRFVRPSLLEELKKLIDKFVADGVVKDDDCPFASPLVVVQKKDGGIRLAVDYREVNLQLNTTANMLPYQSMLFQQLGGKKYYAKVDNLWGYHQLRLYEDSSKITAVITPWGVYRFLACPFGISTATGEYQARLQSFILMIRYGADPGSFLTVLDQVLLRMVQYNVHLKPSK
jgi:hypothetical protein